MLALIALLAAADAPVQIARADVTIREQIIIRVPTRMPPPPPMPPRRWHARRGPSCIEANDIAAAAVTSPNQVDMILHGGARVRADLERACPALNFYSGFYLAPTEDGRICAERDAIHSRSGGSCEIERFRRLMPERSK